MTSPSVAVVQKLAFPSSSPYFVDLKARVDKYFADNNLEKTANAAMVAKTIFWLTFTWGNIAIVCSSAPLGLSFPVALIFYALAGFGFACIGFNIGHDSIHGSYSKRPWVNAMLAWTFDMMGASSFTWAVAHNFIHHTYTNIRSVDMDLEPGPTMRFYPSDENPPRWIHRFQHIYGWFLYSFIGLIWMYVKDFEQIRRPHPRSGKFARPIDVVQMLVGKSLHIGLMVVMPFLLTPFPWWQSLVGYVLLTMVGGVTLAVVFQLAHVVEGVQFPSVPTPAAGGNRLMGEAWAEHQMRTTANFGKTALCTFITGGLDHQVEHHLFPKICHIHYRALAPIVEQCARDHGLPYVHNGSFFRAVASHTRVMKRIGRGERIGLEGPVTRPSTVVPAELAAAE